jgi:small ligand-binding sensory domain FIST
MSDFRSAHASADSWEAATDTCLERFTPLPVGANLGFLYVTDVLGRYLPQILARFKHATGIEQWVGTLGVGICATGQEYLDRPAVAAMAGVFPPDSYRVFPAVRTDTDELTSALAGWPGAAAAHFAIVHGDPRNPNMADLIVQLASSLNDGFLVGGITSSRASYFQIAGRPTQGGLSGVAFSDRVRVTTGLTQGCSPLGPVRQVTECGNNIAITIDGRPALDVLKEDVGEVLARDLSRAAGYIFAGLPVRGSDTGDYLVRNLLGIDLRNKLIAIGERLTPGDRILFCRRDVDTAYADLWRMVRGIKERLPGEPKGAVYYSCLGRGPYMFGRESEELGTIREALGDLPLVGFFANGEISHDRLYGYTGVLTVFS